MNPQQGEQQGSEPPLIIPPVRQGYGGRPAHRSPPPPVRKRAAAYMAPAGGARVRQDSLTRSRRRRGPGAGRAARKGRMGALRSCLGRRAAGTTRPPASRAGRRRGGRGAGAGRARARAGAAAVAEQQPRRAEGRPGGPADAGAGAERTPRSGPRTGASRRRGGRPPVVPPAPPSPVAWPAPSPPPDGRDGRRRRRPLR